MSLSLRLKTKDAGPPKGGGTPLEKEGLSSDLRGQSTPKIGNGQKILVVDDNPVVLKAFEIKLRASGFNVVTTGNGSAVARIAEHEMPALIVLDINFPADASAMEWSGFSIKQWLGRFPELAKIPVIMITGSDSAKYQAKAKEAGAFALFQKPVNYDELLSTIIRAIGGGSSVASAPESDSPSI